MPVVRDGGRRGRALVLVFLVGVGRLTSALVRPALELAVAVARAGRQEAPPVEPPARLRPVLGFARLPAAALDVVRRTLDEDESFRARVASSSSSSEEALGRAAWLFLHRPEGWEDELAALDAAASTSASVVAEARAERSTARRLEASEAAARRTAGEVVRLQAELARASSALAEERRARRAAEDELASLQRRVSSLERERDAAHRRASAADAELEALRASSSSTVDPSVAAPAPAPSPPSRAADVRLPVVLPRGLLEDAPEAADFLVRVADAVLVVDGYNASLRRWPAEPIAEQRRRLLDALGALSARSGLSVHVVFDGTGDVHRSGAGSGPRLGVQVTFTADEVEADDVILDLVDALPRRRPVVVASNDRRVRREAAARGANLLTQDQLLRVLGAFGG